MNTNLGSDNADDSCVGLALTLTYDEESFGECRFPNFASREVRPDDEDILKNLPYCSM